MSFLKKKNALKEYPFRVEAADFKWCYFIDSCDSKNEVWNVRSGWKSSYTGDQNREERQIENQPYYQSYAFINTRTLSIFMIKFTKKVLRNVSIVHRLLIKEPSGWQQNLFRETIKYKPSELINYSWLILVRVHIHTQARTCQVQRHTWMKLTVRRVQWTFTRKKEVTGERHRDSHPNSTLPLHLPLNCCLATLIIANTLLEVFQVDKMEQLKLGFCWTESQHTQGCLSR